MSEKKIHITVYDDIPEEKALAYVQDVVKHGRISKNNTIFCYLTLFHDQETNQHISVQTLDHRKGDCFKVYLDKHYDKDGNWIKND